MALSPPSAGHPIFTRPHRSLPLTIRPQSHSVFAVHPPRGTGERRAFLPDLPSQHSLSALRELGALRSLLRHQDDCIDFPIRPYGTIWLLPLLLVEIANTPNPHS